MGILLGSDHTASTILIRHRVSLTLDSVLEVELRGDERPGNHCFRLRARHPRYNVEHGIDDALSIL
jgi:hypothetical protein